MKLKWGLLLCFMASLTPAVTKADEAKTALNAEASIWSKTAAALQGHPSDVTVENTKSIAFVSTVNGHRYAIDVSLPDLPPPPQGYPVIYVLDGYGYFTSVAAAVALNGNAPQAIVVGIGYPRTPDWTASVLARHQPLPAARNPSFTTAVGFERQYDMTLPPDDASLSLQQENNASFTRTNFGGLDNFLRVIETDVKPRVYRMAKVDKHNQTLFGHSLGGLAVVEALFKEPAAFRTFVAASPSIWWSHKLVLRGEANFAEQINSKAVAPRVLITIGGEEETPPKLSPELQAKKAEFEARTKENRMIGNACDLASRLRELHGAPGYDVEECVVFPEQTHGISVWPAIGRAVSFAFPK